MTTDRRIYLSPPFQTGSELELLRETLESNWIAPLGPQVDAFEAAFSQEVQVPYAAALSSGTAALHLGLQLLGVEPGDEVICSDLTFVASANAIRYIGAEPVFLDAEPASWNLDPALLEDELVAAAGRGKLPRAAIVVDLYGQCADFGPIEEICNRFGVPLLEDAAEALGASYRGKPAGGFGKLAAFSFNGNKIITTSGGGMLVSNDEALVERARFLASQARDPAPHYEHSEIGYNYRLSNLLAAIGRAQLSNLAERVRKRRSIFDSYRELLGSLPGLEFMPEPGWSRSNRWLTCLTLEESSFGASADAVRRALEAENIEARPIWKPMHLQPLYRDSRARLRGVTAGLFAKGLCLPSGTELETTDLERIASIVQRCHESAADG